MSGGEADTNAALEAMRAGGGDAMTAKRVSTYYYTLSPSP
jgi:hypothetical protein